ncbi:glycerophosphodiester phosphodiesterase family protein [Dysgonomonas sp. Marseille-P4361]|uniref:glycerophosphodiester phosphodiesterase n=1 Tax=Dysgonomonas sp. Marseille-P4361 TaxID=2161820 RepID=UPI000D553C6F|nr:glycerophosphodiester phosphodiesterase family protein [Dysgonomonas sp. Marseille-P4361]
MKKVIALILVLCSSVLFLGAQESLLTLDNYTVPIGKKGAFVGKVVSSNKEKISIKKDASKLFTIDKEGNISLKKDKEVDSNSPISYVITLKQGKQLKDIELVKDNFVRNKVIAHRGAWKKHDVSHNSMSSLKYAIELECEGTEIDVWLSKDDVVVLNHDDNIKGKVVEDTPLSELKKMKLKKGDLIPTLEETIECIKQQNKTKLVIEIKGTKQGKAISDSVVSLVHRMRAQGWVNYISFGLKYLQRVKELDPTAEVAYLESDKTLEELKAANMNGIDLHYNQFLKDPELVNKAKSMGLSTNVWTVNKEEDMKALLEQGLDLITTDEPELLFQLINSK